MTKDIYNEVTERIISALQQGEVPWRRPWEESMPRLGQHRNAFTEHVYTGVNAIVTFLSNYRDPRWCTYHQAEQAGGHVRRGEKSTRLLFMKSVRKTDEATGETSHVQYARAFWAFNVEQCEGLDLQPAEDYKPPAQTTGRHDEAERTILDYCESQRVRYKEQGNRAYYDPMWDSVTVPPFESFTTPEGYYSVAFHELAHSTGHHSRLDRFRDNKEAAHGLEDYSKEELTAELGSCFSLAELGIQSPELGENQAAYLRGWLQALQDDRRMIVSASSHGWKAAQMVLGREPSETNRDN